MRIKWRWPASPASNLRPWYESAYHSVLLALMVPFIYGGIAIALFGITLVMGKVFAMKWLEDVL